MPLDKVGVLVSIRANGNDYPLNNKRGNTNRND